MNKHTKEVFFESDCRGFTLVELLVTLAIISIMSTVLLVDFTGSRVAQEVDGVAREVASAFREAQNYALTGYQGVAGTQPCRFTVAWNGSGYTITYGYMDGANVCNQSSVLRTYALRNGITFSGSGSFFFTLPHAAVSFGGASQAVTITKGTATYTVCTYASGLINHVSGATCP